MEAGTSGWSLHTDVPTSLRYFCSSSLTACLRLTHFTSLPYTSVPYPTQPYNFSCLFRRPAIQPLFRVILNFSSCLILVRMRAQRLYSLPRGASGNWGPLFHFPPASYTILSFQPEDFSALPPAFTLVSCSAYSNLKMEAICFSETSVDIQWTARRYIPLDSALHTRKMYRYLKWGGADSHGYPSILTENLVDRNISPKMSCRLTHNALLLVLALYDILATKKLTDQ
jgi:hypothetical protein